MVSALSHLSIISRSSSVSALHSERRHHTQWVEVNREVFRWVILDDIGQHVYLKKASAVLGSFRGFPTVLSANGFLCIGTTMGVVLVYDFQQQLKCICEPGSSCKIS